jgi:two-component system CheB/CheR fusion protein
MDSRSHMGADGITGEAVAGGASYAGKRPPLKRGDGTRQDSRSIPVGALTGVTVLLVEDDPLSREALEVILAHYGARVVSAATAAQALDLYEGGGLSVLVSDIGLPDFDGCALLRTIRRREAGGGHLPAIAISGYPSRETGRRARSAGFDAFLAKPVPLPVLLQTIDQLTPH